jgi:hypothetical protein
VVKRRKLSVIGGIARRERIGNSFWLCADAGGWGDGVSQLDPVAFVAVPLLLVAIAWLICYFPARRATKIDPLATLRHE